MKDLRTIRIFLSTLFFIGAVAYLAVSPMVHPMVRVVEKVQIVPSLIASCMGTIIVWLCVTFVLGRVYCSTVCPLGTLQDIFIPLRRFIPALNRPFAYHKDRPVKYNILIIYVVCLLMGATAISYWIEPWNIMRNICGAICPSAEESVWLTFGVGVGTGIVAGILSALLIIVCALFTGRGFCNTVCPIGAALGCFNDFTLYHIEIDPDKCINCMKCEEICKSQCVKVVGRYVDNSRCVRCFDCLKVCPNDAIRFQRNRNLRATPLIRKVKTR